MIKLRCRLRTVLWMILVMGLSWFPVAWADLDDGLVAYYPFNGNATDESGNGLNGTVNGATLTMDRFGKENSTYYFNGADDYIKINKNALFEVSSLTISAWVKWEGSTPTDHHAIVSNYSGWLADSDELQHYGLRIAKQSTFSEFFYDDGSQWDDVEGISNIGDGEWHFIVGVLNTGVDAKIYVDGQLENTDTDSIPTSILPSGDLYIGRDGTAEAELRWNGLIDDIRIHNRTLSEDEIQQLYEPDLEPVTCSDDPATYSNETRQAILPCVEIPLYTDINGSPIELTGLYSAVLEIPFGFSEFEAKELNFLEIIEESNPSHARFNPDSGILDIPRIDMPTIVPLLDGETVPGPTLQCNAKLQQSALRAEVLMLQDFDCNLP